MAEQGLGSFVTFEKNEADVRNMRQSFSVSSSAKSDSPKVPHYLRASTGSCHDFCKYGTKHGFEDKSKELSLRKKVSKSLSSDNLELVQIMVSKREKDVKQNSSNPRSPGPRLLSSSPKFKAQLDAKTYSSKKNALSGSKTRLSKNKPLPTKKSISPEPPEIIKREIVLLPSENVESSIERGSTTDSKTSITEENNNHHFEKNTANVKSELLNGTKKSSSSGSLDGKHAKIERNRNIETVEKITLSKKSLSPPCASTVAPKLPLRIARKAGNLKFASPPLKVQKKLNKAGTLSDNEKVKEKTLYVIKTETGNNGLKSTSNNHTVPSTSSSSASKSSSRAKSEKNVKTRYIGKAQPQSEPVEENEKRTLRKNRAMIVPEEKNRAPVKLKFRSGKVVNLQSDNNTPGRLKFRKIKGLGAEDGKVELRRRKATRGAMNDSSTGGGLSKENIVLKHQDVQCKKDTQGLFNIIIEETASKLVKSRKSKVKALVGAFETVISLQDTKLSSQSFKESK